MKKALIISVLTIIAIVITVIVYGVLSNRVSDDASAYYTILDDKEYLIGTQWKNARALSERLLKRQSRPNYGFSGNVPSIFNAGFRFNNISDANGTLAILLSYNRTNVFIKPLHDLNLGNSLADADILCHVIVQPVKDEHGLNTPGLIYAELYDAKTLDHLGSMVDAIVFFGQREIVSDAVGRLLNSIAQMQALGMFHGGVKLDELEYLVNDGSMEVKITESTLRAEPLNEDNCIFLTFEPVGLEHRQRPSSVYSWKYRWSAHPMTPEPSGKSYSYIIIQVNEYEYIGDYSGGAPAYDTTCNAYLLDFHTLQVLATQVTAKTRPSSIHTNLKYGVTKVPMSDTYAAFQELSE
ncbi:MAG: hypothetical protein LBH28_03765 [Oscillospiraceae bacterium]|nr:hypothetical protein [Oscillospiraceae bacterium]